MALTDKLTAIGDAIREKEGSTELIALGDMPTRILNLSTGGGEGEDAVRASVLALLNGEEVEFVIPEGTTKIYDYSFENNQKIKRIVYENEAQVKSFGQGAFQSCSKMLMERFPTGFNATTIPYACFKGCNNITLEEGIPEGVTTLEAYAFSGGFDLQFTTLPSTLTTIYPYAFSYAFSEYNTAPDPLPPEMLTIPAGVQTIDSNAFQGVGLKKIRFLGTPTNMNVRAFQQATAITDIYVPWMESINVGSVAPWGATNATIHYETPADEVIK